MPYFQDKELLQYVERELLPDLAEDCVTEFYDRFGILLDLSPGSLSRIDAVLTEVSVSCEPEALAGSVGAYLGAVFCTSDGARWSPAFDREAGVDGYRMSRLQLYNEDVDVFVLARNAVEGSRSLAESFSLLHRPWRVSVSSHQ